MRSTAEYFGLDELEEEEFQVMVERILKTEYKYSDYRGRTITHLPYGGMDFYLYSDTAKHKDSKSKYTNIHFHAASNKYKSEYRIIGEADCDNDTNFRQFIVTPPLGRGLVKLNLINSDALPCLSPGEIICGQTVAFPYYVDYFESEEEYEQSEKEIFGDEDGEPLLLSNGIVIPAGLIVADEISQEIEDDAVLLKAEIIDVGFGKIEFNDTYYYMRVGIETFLGPMLIVHPVSYLTREEFDKVKPGNIVSGLFWLQTDTLCSEYGDGMVISRKNNLKLLKHVMMSGEEDKLEKILAHDAVYKTDNSDEVYVGIEDIVDRFSYVNCENSRRVFVHEKVIVDIEGAEEKAYKAGEPCLVIAYDEPHNYTSILFITENEEGLVNKIEIVNDQHYIFGERNSL